MHHAVTPFLIVLSIVILFSNMIQPTSSTCTDTMHTTSTDMSLTVINMLSCMHMKPIMMTLC